jgi:hypothetical protein
MSFYCSSFCVCQEWDSHNPQQQQQPPPTPASNYTAPPVGVAPTVTPMQVPAVATPAPAPAETTPAPHISLRFTLSDQQSPATAPAVAPPAVVQQSSAAQHNTTSVEAPVLSTNGTQMPLAPAVKSGAADVVSNDALQSASSKDSVLAETAKPSPTMQLVRHAMVSACVCCTCST